MKFIRCRLERMPPDLKKSHYIRDWVPETDATLGTLLHKDGIMWKIVSIDRGTYMERVA